jgi:hypothetical protein
MQVRICRGKQQWLGMYFHSHSAANERFGSAGKHTNDKMKKSDSSARRSKQAKRSTAQRWLSDWHRSSVCFQLAPLFLSLWMRQMSLSRTFSPFVPYNWLGHHLLPLYGRHGERVDVGNAVQSAHSRTVSAAATTPKSFGRMKEKPSQEKFRLSTQRAWGGN